MPLPPPADGLVIYQTDNTPGLYVRKSGVWGAAGAGGSTSTGPTLQLVATKNTPQTGTVASGAGLTPASDILTFNNTGGSLTGGNTWANNTFTVGSTGAGLYQINVQVTIDQVSAYPMLELNGGGVNNQNNVYGISNGTNQFGAPSQNRNYRGVLSATIPLAAGEYFQVRGQTVSTVYGGIYAGDNSCKLTVVKLN